MPRKPVPYDRGPASVDTRRGMLVRQLAPCADCKVSTFQPATEQLPSCWAGHGPQWWANPPGDRRSDSRSLGEELRISASFSAYRRNSLSNGHVALTKIPC